MRRRWRAWIRRALRRGGAIAATVTVAGAPVGASPADAHFVAGCKKGRCKRHVVAPFGARLQRMASCESTHRWHLDGMFDGGLQFSPSTWRQTGSGYAFAYQAPALEQKYRAVIWASRIGWAWSSTAGWPRCGA